MVPSDNTPEQYATDLLFTDGMPIIQAEQGYRGHIAANAAGITYRQLDYWARTGLVEPTVQSAQGSGSQRLYGFRDILVLKLVKRLLDTDPGAARRDLVQRLGLPDYAVYATFLPYAVLFELEDSWSGAFPDLTEEQLHSTGLYLASTFAVHNLMSVGASTVSAASTPPKASGGSGFSGGGFSGGGGGGGGGGSW